MIGITKRIVTYIISVKPESHILINDATIVISDVTEEEFLGIRDAIEKYITRYFKIIYKESSIVDTDVMINVDSYTLPYKMSNEFPKLYNNRDFIRYLLASKILWPDATIYISDQSLTDSLQPDMIIDVPWIPKNNSLPIYKYLCNTVTDDEEFTDRVHTIVSPPNLNLLHMVDITEVLEIL